jgi:tripartite ATP-independent transporter DctM subunit
MWTTKVAGHIKKYLEPVSWWCVILGMVAMAVITLVVVIDVTMRAILSMPLYGNIYIIGVMLIIVFFAPYAYCELKKEHIQVDVLVRLFSKTNQQIINTNGYFINIAIATILSWRMFNQAAFYKKGNIVTALLGIPEWIFIMLTGLFMVLFIFALFVNFFNHLGQFIQNKGFQAYLWLIPGMLMTSGLFLFSINPEWMPFEISYNMWGIFIFVALFILIFFNVHIGISMSMISVLGLSYLSGFEASLTNLTTKFIHVANQYTWSVAPLFLWMGTLAYWAGFARELYDVSYKWLGRLPGGLASASTGACAGLAAITGSSMTGVLTMGVLGLPEMRRYKYDMKLATASICTSATIGMLIPPSIAFIVYGILTEISIGRLFIAGILPGILFTAILIALITIMCTLNPKLGPPGPSTSWKEKMVSLKGIVAVLVLVLFVLGGMYAGLFTATEAGAIGSFGALVIGFIRRRLTFEGLVNSMSEAVRINGLIMFIFVSAIAFSSAVATTQVPNDLASWVISLQLSKYAILAVILFIYMVLGCLMNALPAIILTLPIFFPITMEAGIDPVLLGVLIVVMADLGQITPPIGMNVFAMSAIAKDVPMYSIFRGVLPFWGAFLVLIVILVLFPKISLLLPNLMMG